MSFITLLTLSAKITQMMLYFLREEQTLPQILKGPFDPKVITISVNYYRDSTPFALIPLLTKESSDS